MIWMLDHLFDLTIKIDTGQQSHFSQMFENTKWKPSYNENNLFICGRGSAYRSARRAWNQMYRERSSIEKHRERSSTFWFMLISLYFCWLLKRQCKQIFMVLAEVDPSLEYKVFSEGNRNFIMISLLVFLHVTTIPKIGITLIANKWHFS